MEIPDNDPVVVIAVLAIRQGDLDALRAVLAAHPELAEARIRDSKGGTRTPLHDVADWPGYFPNGPEVVCVLVAAGADPNAPITGVIARRDPAARGGQQRRSGPCHRPDRGRGRRRGHGASIAGRTPWDNAVAYGCWHVARLLVERGAQRTVFGRQQPWG